MSSKEINDENRLCEKNNRHCDGDHAVGLPPLGLAAQDKPADNMQILRDKLKADKKLVVAENMELTESEAKELLADLRPVSKGIAEDQSSHRQSAGELRR